MKKKNYECKKKRYIKEKKITMPSKLNILSSKIKSGNFTLQDFLNYDSNIKTRVLDILDIYDCSLTGNTEHSCTCESLYYIMYLLINLDAIIEKYMKMGISGKNQYKFIIKYTRKENNKDVAEANITTTIYNQNNTNFLKELNDIVTKEINNFKITINPSYSLAIHELLTENFYMMGNQPAGKIATTSYYIKENVFNMYVDEKGKNIFIKPISDLILIDLVKKHIIPIKKFCYSNHYREPIDTNSNFQKKFSGKNLIFDKEKYIHVFIPAYHYLIIYSNDKININNENTNIGIKVTSVYYNNSKKTILYNLNINKNDHYLISEQLNEFHKSSVVKTITVTNYRNIYIYTSFILLLILTLLICYFLIFYNHSKNDGLKL